MLQWQSALRDGLLEAGVLPNNGFTYDHIYGTKVGGTILTGMVIDIQQLICLSMLIHRGLRFTCMLQYKRSYFQQKVRDFSGIQ